MHCLNLFTTYLLFAASFIFVEINARLPPVAPKNNTEIIIQQKMKILTEIGDIWFNGSHVIEIKLYKSNQTKQQVDICEDTASKDIVPPYRDALFQTQDCENKEKSMNIKANDNNAELLHCFNNVIIKLRKSLTGVITNTIKCLAENSSH